MYLKYTNKITSANENYFAKPFANFGPIHK